MIRRLLCILEFHKPDKELTYDDFSSESFNGYSIYKYCKYCGRGYIKYYEKVPILFIGERE